MKENSKVIAAFDFDGTLTFHDTLITFLTETFGNLSTYAQLVAISPKLWKYPLGLQSRHEAKEIVLTQFLQGRPLSWGELAGKVFGEGPLNKKLNPEGMKKVRWHQEQGHTTVLVSANLSLFLAPFGKQHHFDHCLATELELDSKQCFTGKLLGPNCRGKEKVRRIQEAYGDKSNYTLYAYGNSDGDKEMLDYADYPFYKRF